MRTLRAGRSFLAGTMALSLLAAAIAAAQSAPSTGTRRAQPDAPKAPPPTAEPQDMAKTDTTPGEKAKETPATPPRPAPVKYTELKKTPWPPKAGVKTPGVQIPITNLKPEAEIALTAPAGAILLTADQVLIAVPASDQLVRAEGRSNKVLEAFSGIAKPCGGLASAFRNLWVVACGNQTVARLETATGKQTASISTGTGPAPQAIAASADSVWVLTDDKTTLTRIDPDTNAVVSEVRLPGNCSSVVVAESSLWVTCPGEKRVIRINPQTNLVTARIEVTPEPVSIAFGGATAAENSIWVLSRREGKVARIDPKTNKVIATVNLGFTNADGNLAFGDGSLWVTAPGFPITRINPQLEKERVVQQFVGDGGGMIQFGLNSIWLTNTAYNNVWRIDPKRVAATLAE